MRLVALARKTPPVVFAVLLVWLLTSGALGHLARLPVNLGKYFVARGALATLGALGLEPTPRAVQFSEYLSSFSSSFWTDPFQLFVYWAASVSGYRVFRRSEHYKQAASMAASAASVASVMGYLPPAPAAPPGAQAWKAFDKSASISYSRFGKSHATYVRYNPAARVAATGLQVFVMREGVGVDATQPPGTDYPYTAEELGFDEYKVVALTGEELRWPRGEKLDLAEARKKLGL